MLNSASAPTIGPPTGPGGNNFPPRPPLNPPTCGAKLFYDLPSVDVLYPRTVINISVSQGPAVQHAPLATATEGADVFYEPKPLNPGPQCSMKGSSCDTSQLTTQTQRAFLNYEGDLTHPTVYKPGVKSTIVVFGSQAQRPNDSGSDLTKESFLSHRDICTPCTHKHTRAPARRFGPGPGLSFHERFRSSPDLTHDSYLKNGSPSQHFTKRRNPSAVIMGSTRSGEMDTRMERRANAELMRFL